MKRKYTLFVVILVVLAKAVNTMTHVVDDSIVNHACIIALIAVCLCNAFIDYNEKENHE